MFFGFAKSMREPNDDLVRERLLRHDIGQHSHAPVKAQEHGTSAWLQRIRYVAFESTRDGTPSIMSRDVNYKFVVGDLFQRIPEDYLKRLGVEFVEGIQGPADLVQTLRLRRRAERGGALPPTVPADTFILDRGEPRRRHVTKLGGLPYRPAGKPWPKTREGRPFTFLCQFCFADSVDILPTLPGDILLVFLSRDDFNPTIDDASLCRFEWHSLGIRDLITRAELPDGQFEVLPAFGYRYRTVDFATDDAWRAIYRGLPRKLLMRMDPYSSNGQAEEQCPELEHLAHMNGLKIGGYPYFVSYGDDPELPLKHRQEGTLLGSVFSHGEDGTRQTFLRRSTHSKPFEHHWVTYPRKGDRREHRTFSLSDWGATLNVFLTSDQQVVPQMVYSSADP